MVLPATMVWALAHPLALIAAAALLAVLVYGFHPVARYRLRAMPGPPALPFIGNLGAFKSPGQVEAFAAWRQKYGPVYKFMLGACPVVVIADPAEGRRANLKHHMRHPMPPPLTNGRWGSVGLRGLFAAGSRDRDLHRELKAAWAPMFSGPSLAGFADEMAAGADRLGDRLAAAAEAGQEVDVWRMFGALTLEVVANCAFGIDLAAQADGAPSSAEAARLLDAARTVFATGRLSSTYGLLYQTMPEALPLIRALATRAPGPPLAKFEAARGAIMSKALALVDAEHARAAAAAAGGSPPSPASPTGGGAACRSVAKGSFLSLFARGARRAARSGGDGAFDDETVASQAFTFLLAGYETTATALAFCMYCLAANPGAAAKMVAELQASVGGAADATAADVAALPYLDAVFKEALRLYPPAPMTLRVAGEDCVIGGYPVPKGTWLQVDTRTIQRDPEVWGPDAAEFRPERWLDGSAASDHWLVFGGGTLLCVGSKFATAEAKITLARLWARFDFSLAPGVPARELPVETRLTMGPKHGVFLRPSLRVGRGAGAAPVRAVADGAVEVATQQAPPKAAATVPPPAWKAAAHAVVA